MSHFSQFLAAGFDSCLYSGFSRSNDSEELFALSWDWGRVGRDGHFPSIFCNIELWGCPAVDKELDACSGKPFRSSEVWHCRITVSLEFAESEVVEMPIGADSMVATVELPPTPWASD